MPFSQLEVFGVFHYYFSVLENIESINVLKNTNHILGISTVVCQLMNNLDVLVKIVVRFMETSTVFLYNNDHMFQSTTDFLPVFAHNWNIWSVYFVSRYQ